MKNKHNHSLLVTGTRVFLSIVLVVLWTSCSDEAMQVSSKQKGAALNRIQSQSNRSSNSTSSAGDYNISLSVDGLTWTYVITKNPGAKNLSHFILNFQNCGARSATLDNIVWATVNGQPAVLENSEGNTGCDVASVTTNFVKFDNLPDANSYTIVFQTDILFGHFVGTTAWLKAGTSCFTYPVLAPCCPL